MVCSCGRNVVARCLCHERKMWATKFVGSKINQKHVKSLNPEAS